ncbi:SDR family oxidoreductase, partial [Pseudomonas guariconensis]|uniref:SDR family oxidoreductase n=1 Tax=Pseudomonas guariconensis TaxID=1288410 RepID=UPI00293EAE56
MLSGILVDSRVDYRGRCAVLSPLGRLGLPKEAAQAILFLASPLSAYTTGSHI